MEMSTEHKASRRHKDSFSEVELQNLAVEVNQTEWKPLGRHLGVKESTLDAIEYDNESKGLHEIIFRMLLTWQHLHGSKADRGKLVEALEKIGRADLIENLMKGGTTDSLYKLSQEPYRTILEEFQSNLLTAYTDLELPRVSWLRDKHLPLQKFYVDLTLHRMDKYGIEVVEFDLDIEEIFIDVQGKSTKRILVEGDPGYGKTTLACKLATDWVNEKTYIRERFTLIFIIIVRYFEGDINELFLESCDNEDFTEKEVLDTIHIAEEKTLLIIDGFDEADEGIKKYLFPILNRDKFSSMTVLVTSRPGEVFFEDFQKKRKKHINALSLIGAKNEVSVSFSLWHKRIQIRGISDENRKEFLSRYLERDVEELEHKELSLFVSDSLKNLYECPLFLILMAILIEEKEIETINTKTDLFINVMNFLLKSNLQRVGKMDAEEKFDIFEFKKKEPPFFVLFGKLALEKIKQNKLTFSEDEVVACCGSKKMASCLGILKKIISFSNKKIQKSYDCIHKSFIEFLAAFYLSIFLFEESETNEFQELFFSFIKTEHALKHFSFFLSFVIGLLRSKAHVVFRSLSPYAAFFPVNGEFFRNVYTEIELTNETIQSIVPFIPPLWKIEEDAFFTSPLHSILLQIASDKKLINNFIWNLRYKANVPQGFTTNILHLKLNDTSWPFTNVLQDVRLNCTNVTFHITMTEIFWEFLTLLVGNVTCENAGFILRFETSDDLLLLFEKEILDGKWKTKKIRHILLEIYPQDILKALQVVTHLVEKEAFTEKVVISIAEFPNWIPSSELKIILDTLMNRVVNSSNLEKFIFHVAKGDLESDLLVDFSIFTKKRSKKWKFLYIDNCAQWNDTAEFSDITSIDSILVDSRRKHQLSIDSSLISHSQGIQRLMISSDLFLCVIKTVDADWHGFQTVTFIEITIEETFRDSDFKCLSYFTNLKIFNLMLTKNMSIETFDTFLQISCGFSLNMFYVTVTENNLKFLKLLLEAIEIGTEEKILLNKTSNLERTAANGHNLKEDDSKYFAEILKISFYFPEIFLEEKEVLKDIFTVVKSLLDKRRIKEFSSNSSHNLAERNFFHFGELSKSLRYVRQIQPNIEGNYCKYFNVAELEPISVFKCEEEM